MVDKKSRKKAEDVLVDYHQYMGNRPDGEIAQLAGVQRNTVMAYRRRHKIPSYEGHRFKPKSEREAKEVNVNEEVTPAVVDIEEFEASEMDNENELDSKSVPSRPRQRRRSKLDPYVDKIGIIPDREVAEIAGVTSENVRAFRNRRGIPARWRGEGEPLPRETEVLAAFGRPVDDEPQVAAPVVAPVRVPVEAPATVVAPVVVEAPVAVVAAAPAAAPVGQSMVIMAQGFVVTVELGDDQEEFVVVGADIAQAAAQAISSLTKRGDRYKVLSIRYLADALIG